MKKSVSISLILFLALIIMLFHADWATEGARYGLLLWYNSVVPALFPFMVLSGLIVSSGGVSVIMEPVYRVLHPVLPISKNGCYVLVSGLLCGCPMGAKTCADFVRDGRISLEEGKFLLAICNHPSPMFLLGYVYPFFSESFHIAELLFCVYVPVILLAFAAKLRYFSHGAGTVSDRTGRTASEKTPENRISDEGDPAECTRSSLDDTILSVVEILCKIGGYLVLFSIIIVFLRNTAEIPKEIKLALIGVLEMTTGIRELSASLSPVAAFIGSVAALTFGGLSGLFQTKAVLIYNKKRAGLSIRPYFLWKLAHAALAAGFAFLICISFQHSPL